MRTTGFHRFAATLFFTLVSSVVSPVSRAGEIKTFAPSRVSHVRLTINNFIRGSLVPGESARALKDLAPGGARDLAVIYAVAVSALENPHLPDEAERRIQQILRREMETKAVEDAQTSAEWQALAGHAAWLLTHYRGNALVLDMLTHHMTEFSLWNERSLDYVKARLAEGITPQLIEILAVMFCTVKGESLTELKKAVNAAGLHDKIKLSLYARANILEHEHIVMLFSIAANEFAATLEGRSHPVEDDWHGIENRHFAYALDLVHADYVHEDPRVIQVFMALRSYYGTFTPSLFFTAWIHPDFDWRAREDWQRLAQPDPERAPAPAAQPSARPLLRSIDCGPLLGDRGES